MYLGVPPSRPRVLVPTLAVLCLCTVLAPPGRGAEVENAEGLKAQADRWFELEKRTADERNEWRTQKEVLTTSIEVLKKERTALQARLEANELATGLFTKRVEGARAELAGQEGAHARLAEGCTAIEDRLRTLFVRLPEPLQEKVGPLLDKLRRASADAPLKVSERTQLVVAALTAIDLFNNSLTLTHHLRKNGAGETLDVKVLYWGLAMGFGVDANGTHAWLLTPGAAGWDWQEAPAQVLEIKTLVGVYEKQQNPQVVTISVAAAGGAK